MVGTPDTLDTNSSSRRIASTTAGGIPKSSASPTSRAVASNSGTVRPSINPSSVNAVSMAGNTSPTSNVPSMIDFTSSMNSPMTGRSSMKSISNPGKSSGPVTDAGSALATAELKPAHSCVMIPKKLKSDAGLPPRDESKMLGIRSTTRPRIPAGVMSCSLSARVSMVNAPIGRFGTPPGAVTDVPPVRYAGCSRGRRVRSQYAPQPDQLRCAAVGPGLASIPV